MLHTNRMCATIVAVALAAACSGQGPVEPTSLAGAESTTQGSGVIARAASSRRPAPTVLMDALFGGDIVSESFALSGSVSGAPGSRIIKAASTGSAVLTVVRVVPDQSPWEFNCDGDNQQLLLDAGLLGLSVTGTFSWFNVDEAAGYVNFRMDGIRPAGSTDTWHIAGNSGAGAIISPTANGLQITQTFGELSIKMDVKGKNPPGASCRADWTITIGLPS